MNSGNLHIPAVLPDRLKAPVVAWPQAIPAAIRKRISSDCTNRWEAYVTAAEEVLRMQRS